MLHPPFFADLNIRNACLLLGNQPISCSAKNLGQAIFLIHFDNERFDCVAVKLLSLFVIFKSSTYCVRILFNSDCVHRYRHIFKTVKMTDKPPVHTKTAHLLKTVEFEKELLPAHFENGIV